MKLNNLNARLFKIEHQFTVEKEHQLLLKCDIEVQRELFSFIKTFENVEVPTKDNITTYAYMTEYQFIQFKKFSKLTGIEYEIIDISKKAILDQLDSDIINNSYVVNNIITPFLQQNLTIDIVLDKMSYLNVPVEKLSKLDLAILNQTA